MRRPRTGAAAIHGGKKCLLFLLVAAKQRVIYLGRHVRPTARLVALTSVSPLRGLTGSYSYANRGIACEGEVINNRWTDGGMLAVETV